MLGAEASKHLYCIATGGVNSNAIIEGMQLLCNTLLSPAPAVGVPVATTAIPKRKKKRDRGKKQKKKEEKEKKIMVEAPLLARTPDAYTMEYMLQSPEHRRYFLRKVAWTLVHQRGVPVIMAEASNPLAPHQRALPALRLLYFLFENGIPESILFPEPKAKANFFQILLVAIQQQDVLWTVQLAAMRVLRLMACTGVYHQDFLDLSIPQALISQLLHVCFYANTRDEALNDHINNLMTKKKTLTKKSTKEDESDLVNVLERVHHWLNIRVRCDAEVMLILSALALNPRDTYHKFLAPVLPWAIEVICAAGAECTCRQTLEHECCRLFCTSILKKPPPYLFSSFIGFECLKHLLLGVINVFIWCLRDVSTFHYVMSKTQILTCIRRISLAVTHLQHPRYRQILQTSDLFCAVYRLNQALSGRWTIGTITCYAAIIHPTTHTTTTTQLLPRYCARFLCMHDFVSSSSSSEGLLAVFLLFGVCHFLLSRSVITETKRRHAELKICRNQ